MAGIPGWRSQVARWSHKPEVAGSNPAPGTKVGGFVGIFSPFNPDGAAQRLALKDKIQGLLYDWCADKWHHDVEWLRW